MLALEAVASLPASQRPIVLGGTNLGKIIEESCSTFLLLVLAAE